MRRVLQVLVLVVAAGLFVLPAQAQVTNNNGRGGGSSNGGGPPCPCDSPLFKIDKYEVGSGWETSGAGFTLFNFTNFKENDSAEPIAGEWEYGDPDLQDGVTRVALVRVKIGGGNNPDACVDFSNDGYDGEGIFANDDDFLPDGNEDTYAISHVNFCGVECIDGAPRLLTSNEDEQDGRTITNTIEDLDGIEKFEFTVFENFTLTALTDQNGINRLSEYNSSTNVWENDDTTAPTQLTFVLEADADAETARYFLKVQDECGIISDIDPLYDFAKLGTNQLALDGNYPNPFGEQTTIHFTLPEASEVTVSVFDITGRKVATLVNQSLVAGAHDVQWNGRADSGRRLASGVYFYRIEAGDFSQTRRMTLVR